MLSSQRVLALLAVLGVISLLFSLNPMVAISLMGLAYLSNTSYSMVSRSAVRNSPLYHAIALLFSTLCFYSVLYKLKTNNIDLELFIPYTVATVYGSISGVKLSMRVEKLFGISSDTNPTASSRMTIVVKRSLLILLGSGVAWTMYATNQVLVPLGVIVLVLLDNMLFSLVRRSRNTDNTTYHIFAFLTQSLIWFVLFRNLSLNNLALTLFLPYSFGSVLGGLAGQELSLKVERILGASVDGHLGKKVKDVMPTKAIAILVLLGLFSVLFAISPYKALIILLLSLGQQVAFSLVSRSRARSNATYHIISAILSNGVWFLTFRQLNSNGWIWTDFFPYATGGAGGSITGVGVSMVVETKLNITADSKT